MNFIGQNALDEAIKARDYVSFQYLLQELVHDQNRPESAILVDSWLSAAI